MIPQIQECIDHFKWLCFDDLKDVRCWIAGGALRNYFTYGHTTGSDVDVFFPDAASFDSAKELLTAKKAKQTFKNERIINFLHNKHKIQLIRRYFTSPTETIENFDFTVCCAAVDINDVYHHQTFFMDLAKKRLVINALPYPLSTMQRMQRYIKNGFTICNHGLLTIAKAMKDIDFENPEQNNIEFYPDKTPKFVRWD
jgi:hypothetical protein